MENATIEKRAERHADNSGFRSDREWRSVKQCCFEMATEQRDIDIKAAEDWFCLHECKHTGCVDDKTCGILEGLRNAMKGGNK